MPRSLCNMEMKVIDSSRCSIEMLLSINMFLVFLSWNSDFVFPLSVDFTLLLLE